MSEVRWMTNGDGMSRTNLSMSVSADGYVVSDVILFETRGCVGTASLWMAMRQRTI